jgi:hypothetical protein
LLEKHNIVANKIEEDVLQSKRIRRLE